MVREDGFLEALEGSIQFLPADMVMPQSRQYGTSIVQQMPVCITIFRVYLRNVDSRIYQSYLHSKQERKQVMTFL